MTVLFGVSAFNTSSPYAAVAQKPVQPLVPQAPLASDRVELRFAGKEPRLLPNYFRTPSQDFARITRDYEESFWTKAHFPWQQDIRQNLVAHVDALPEAELARVATMVLPLVDAFMAEHLTHIQKNGLPLDADKLKAIASLLPEALSGSLNQAIAIQEPLRATWEPIRGLEDRLALVREHYNDLKEQKVLGLFKDGNTVKRLETEAEKQQVDKKLALMDAQKAKLKQEIKTATVQARRLQQRVKPGVAARFESVTPKVKQDIEALRAFIADVTKNGLPKDPDQLAMVKELIVKRQFRGLQDVTNHALVAEQTAVAPLTTGVIRHRRDPEIQEAMTTFIQDEAKHSAVFRRYHVDKLGAKPTVPAHMVAGGERFLMLARVAPQTSVFLAIVVETIGGAFFEFFGKYAPEPLFRQMCQTIAEKDERRHMDLCTALYNEKYRTNSSAEVLQNRVALRGILTAVYGDRNMDHYLIQACKSFGLDPMNLYNYIAQRLNEEFAKIGFDAQADKIMKDLLGQ